MKTPLFIAALLAFTIASSQDISLPMKDNSIHYNNIVLTDKDKSIEAVFETLNQWIDKNSNQYEFTQKDHPNIPYMTSVKGKVNIDPDRRNMHNVDCSFTMDIVVIDGRYRAEVYDFNFIKAEQKFDASEVYKSYLKRDPFVKTALETRDAALERHQYLLERLQAKVNAMLASMQKATEE